MKNQIPLTYRKLCQDCVWALYKTESSPKQYSDHNGDYTFESYVKQNTFKSTESIDRIEIHAESYVKQHTNETKYIWPLSMCDSEAEVETIKQDLFEFGYLPPKSYCRNGFWIIEMPMHAACEIINRHSKGTLAMRCYCGDECLHENMWLRPIETYVKPCAKTDNLVWDLCKIKYLQTSAGVRV